MTATISVIVPTLDAEKTLPGCLQALIEGLMAGLLVSTERPTAHTRLSEWLSRNAETVGAKMDEEIAIFVKRLQSAEAREAFTAFMEKRQPDFSKF